MDVIAQVFGPLAAVGVVIVLWWKYIRPKLDAADKERVERVKRLESEIVRLSTEREEAKDAVIQAFGDIGDSFQNFAQDIQVFVESEFDNHEHGAKERYQKLYDKLDEHKNEIIQKLGERSRDVRPD